MAKAMSDTSYPLDESKGLPVIKISVAVWNPSQTMTLGFNTPNLATLRS